jgi:tRNA modification GTPase
MAFSWHTSTSMARPDPRVTARLGGMATPGDEATVASLVTAPGRSAIASVVVRGPKSLHAVAELCRVPAGRLARYAAQARLWLGHWNGSNGEAVVVRVCDGNTVEIHCHGGAVSSQRILNDLATAGVATLGWQDVHTGASTLETESLVALTQAPTVRTAAILLDQYRGALASAVRAARIRLEAGNASEAGEHIREMLEWAPLGRHLVAPWRVAIVGRPNVGKSSLLNAIVGYDRAIVHPVAGTTRDLVTAVTAIDGWPVEFVDSAGIRETSDEIEAAGVVFSRRAIEESDRQIVVLDRSQALNDGDAQIVRACPASPLLVSSKSDLPAAWQSTPWGNACATSSRVGSGFRELLSEIAGSLVPRPPEPGAAVPFTERQVSWLRAAEAAVTGHRDSTLAHDALARCMNEGDS